MSRINITPKRHIVHPLKLLKRTHKGSRPLPIRWIHFIIRKSQPVQAHVSHILRVQVWTNWRNLGLVLGISIHWHSRNLKTIYGVHTIHGVSSCKGRLDHVERRRNSVSIRALLHETRVTVVWYLHSATHIVKSVFQNLSIPHVWKNSMISNLKILSIFIFFFVPRSPSSLILPFDFLFRLRHVNDFLIF